VKVKIYLDVLLPPGLELPSAHTIFDVFQVLREAFAEGIDSEHLWEEDVLAQFRPDIAMDVRVEDNVANWLETLAIDYPDSWSESPSPSESSSAEGQASKAHGLITSVNACTLDPEEDEVERIEVDVYKYPAVKETSLDGK
jgi:hypothetical protein